MFNQVFGTMLVLVSVAITIAAQLMHQGTDSHLVAALAVAGVIVYIQSGNRPEHARR